MVRVGDLSQRAGFEHKRNDMNCFVFGHHSGSLLVKGLEEARMYKRRDDRAFDWVVVVMFENGGQSKDRF